MVVGLVVEDGEGAIELFGKEQAYHLMGERHLRKRDHFIAPFVHRRGEAVRTADNENQTAGAGSHALVEPRGKVHAATLRTVLVEQHHTVARLQTLQDEAPLLLLLLLLGERPRLTQLGDDFHPERDVVRETLAIVLEGGCKMRVGGLADNKEEDLHEDKSTEKFVRKKQDDGKMAGKMKKTGKLSTVNSQLSTIFRTFVCQNVIRRWKKSIL